MKKTLKILMLEDLAEDAGLISHALKKEKIIFVSERVDTEDEFVEALNRFNPDVILSDHALPQFSSEEALKICIEKGLNIPFILVTGAVSEEFAVNCLRQGADDYVLKGNLSRLPSAILNSLKQKALEIDRLNAEESLRSQNMELMKINTELDRFVYSASHDLRAPLKSVLGLVKLAQNDLQNNEFSYFTQYLLMMEQSVHKLDETIKDIIDYSRNTRTEVESERVDLNNLLMELTDKLKYMEGFENMEKKISVDESIPLFSDLIRLSIIFNNLISNSIKYRNIYLEKSFFSIDIKVFPEKAVIVVEDNGIGIGDKYIDKIFNMFYRATEKSEGSGLGLYIVKEALDKLKGSIKVDSKINKGTTFRIEIPNLTQKKTARNNEK
jgi:signal transduction histidine kinase